MYWRNEISAKFGDDKSKTIKLFSYIFTLKNLLRTGWVKYWGVREEQAESVADHSFSVVVLALFLQKQLAPELDQNKVLKMAILHELGEAIIGDMPVRDNVEDKHEREKQAMEEILSSFDFAPEFLSLWEEFEKEETPEAKFVKSIDRLEFVLQRYGYFKNGIGDMLAFKDGKERVLEKIKNEKVKEIAKEVLDEIETL